MRRVDDVDSSLPTENRLALSSLYLFKYYAGGEAVRNGIMDLYGLGILLAGKGRYAYSGRYSSTQLVSSSSSLAMTITLSPGGTAGG